MPSFRVRYRAEECGCDAVRILSQAYEQCCSAMSDSMSAHEKTQTLQNTKRDHLQCSHPGNGLTCADVASSAREMVMKTSYQYAITLMLFLNTQHYILKADITLFNILPDQKHSQHATWGHFMISIHSAFPFLRNQILLY